MAFVSNFDQDEDKKAPSQGVVSPVGGPGLQLAPSSGVGSAGNPGTSAPGAGGKFATLQTYLDANQGQAPGLANNITKGIGDQYTKLEGANTNTLNDISSQVTGGYTPQNDSLLASEAANPVSFASNPGNVSAFKAQANDKYTGPGSAEGTGGYQSQWAAVNNAIANGQGQVGTEAGREGLLQGVEARPTAGVTALNSAILSQDPNSQSQIENAYKPFSNLTSQLSQGAQGIDTNIGQAQSSASKASAAANKAIADQTAALNAGVNKNLSNAQSQYDKYNADSSDLAKSFASGTLPNSTNQGVDKRLVDFFNSQVNPWLSANASGQTPTYNFSNALPQIPTAFAPTIAQTATSNDVDTYNALSSLNGSPIASPLQGIKLAGTPYNVPTLPQADNKALAGDIMAGLQGLPVKVSSAPYQQYLSLLQMLQKAQNEGPTAFGEFSRPPNPPGTPGGPVAAR